MKEPIYFDYAAATPVDEQVLEAMAPFMRDAFYNPSALYLPAIQIRKQLEAARGQVARVLGSRPNEIIFTAGATEANNLVIRGVMAAYPEAKLVVSAIEHDSVLQPARLYDHIEAPVLPDGVIDLAKLEQAIDDRTVLVSIMYANNEVGTVQPLRDIAQRLERIWSERRKRGNDLPLYLHTDAAQAGNYLELQVSRLGVDFLTLNGGKIYGPKQSGILYAAASTRFEPLIIGGGQEHGRRGGTENVPGSIGFARALVIAQSRKDEEVTRLKKLQQLFFDLLEAQLPGSHINGSRKLRLPNNVHVTLPGQDNERLIMALDEAGILAAAGSACSASSEEPSHVLKAMGLSDEEARASLRLTMGRSTNEAAIRQTVEMLARIIAD